MSNDYMSQCQPGFVYIMSNVSMPGLLKIGRTVNHPAKRAQELYSTGVPTPFTIEFVCWSHDCVSAELDVHEQLGKHRASKEFFAVSIQDAVFAVLESCVREEFELYPAYEGWLIDPWHAHLAAQWAECAEPDVPLMVGEITPEEWRILHARLIRKRELRKHAKRDDAETEKRLNERG